MNLPAVNKHIKALVNLALLSEWKGLFKCIEQSGDSRFEIKSTSWRLNVTWPPICFITGGSSSYLHTKEFGLSHTDLSLGRSDFHLQGSWRREKQREIHISEIIYMDTIHKSTREVQNYAFLKSSR